MYLKSWITGILFVCGINFFNLNSCPTCLGRIKQHDPEFFKYCMPQKQKTNMAMQPNTMGTQDFKKQPIHQKTHVEKKSGDNHA